MPRILSQSGVSLADIYDVEGSIAGIETIETHNLPIVHELGATVFSERASGTIRRMTTGAILQNVDSDVTLTDLPGGLVRILGVSVFSDVGSRINNACLTISDGGAPREIPLFIWDNGEATISARMDDDGAGVATLVFMVSERTAQGGGIIPSMLFGSDQPQRVDEISLHVQSTGFGAGDVTVTALIYIGFSQVGGGQVSSYGLPIPGW